MSKVLKAPFPYFGGKSKVAHLVWDRFGDVVNYCEPFCGSCAVLLARPNPRGVETVNDMDGYLTNFWRALWADPGAVAFHADYPVSEVDLLARHKWLVAQDGFLALMKSDPDYFDVKIAGWWVWGLCSWIGSGWCRQRGDGHLPEQIPHLGSAGRGINRRLPHLGSAGRGAMIRQYFQALSDRLRDVRICCGDYSRVLGPSVTEKHGLTGIFLDPPYSEKEHSIKYSAHSDVYESVREWAISNGNNPSLRIAVCGYEDGRAMPCGWSKVHWKAPGGYGSQSDGRGRSNSAREVIWFSPHCIGQGDLFSQEEAE